MPLPARLPVALLMAITCACGGDDDGDRGGSGDAGVGPDASLATCGGLTGRWRSENASNTPDTISHDGQLAITPAGDLYLAFAEPDSDEIFDQDIYVARRGSSGWAAAEPLTADDIQNAFPSILVSGNQVHLVWNGRPGADINDIYYSRTTATG